MSVNIKSSRELDLMRRAGRVLGNVLDRLGEIVRPGISTKDIDDLGYRLIKEQGCVPSFLHYEGYPASICVSVNSEVVHGIPSPKRILKEGDIVSLDAGVNYKGYHSDAARTYGVGRISPEAQRLIDVTKESFFRGISLARQGNHLFEISNAIQTYVESQGYSVVRDLVGHGIGRSVHEEPQVPNFRQRGRGMRLQKGMTLAVEPMVNMGGYAVWWMEDDWTVVTQDGSMSAHYENTIAITDGEPEILSLGDSKVRR